MTSSMVDQTQNEETLRAIFNASKETAFVMKIDGTVVAINETGAARLGQRPEEMIGKSIYQFIPPAVEQRRKPFIEKVIATGQPVTFEDERSGNYIFNSLSPIFNEQGRVDKIAVFGLDITARKKAELILQQHTEELEMLVEERTAALRQANVQLNEEIDERKQAEQRIAEALAFNRHILDTAPVGIVIYEPSGQAIQVNEAAAAAIGATVEQILQQNFRQLESWKQSGLSATAEEALEKNTSTRINLSVRTTFGKEVWLDCRFVPFRWNGEYHLLLIFLDMTEYRRIQEEREAALAFSEQAKTAAEIIDNMIDPVVITDTAGRIRQFNRAFMDAYGYGEEVIGKLPTEIVRTEDIPAVMKSIEQALAEGVVYNFECTVVTREGRQIPVLNNIKLMYDEGGNPKGFLTVLRDITKRKEIEEALQSAHEEMERSYADLEQYAYVASHDLQEPLRMIVSYLQLIERRYRDLLDEDGKTFMDYAVDGAARMQTLIRDLLTYARVGRSGLNLKSTDLKALAGEVLDDLKMTVDESGTVVILDALPVVTADLSQMTQLLQNLISNAVKFRSAKAPEVHIGSRMEGTNWLIFVRDNGIGIDKAHLEKIFTMFQRLQRREDYVGTGVGLAIAKRIVERHRGRIWIESALGAGTTVYFTLPVHAGSKG